MTTEERMAKIAKASAEKVAIIKSEKDIEKEYVKNLANSIMTKYGKQVTEMLVLANTLVKNGYAIQTIYPFNRSISESVAPRFQTDGMYHKIGLHADKNMVNSCGVYFDVFFYAVGYEGGGCSRPTLLVAPEGIKFNNTDISQYGCCCPYNPAYNMWNGCISRLEEFDAEFPALYKRFMEYVDNIDKYPVFR